MSNSIYDIKPNPIFNAALEGTHEGIIAAGQTVEIDYTVPYRRVLNGVQYQADDRNLGDVMDFEVHHPALGLMHQFGKNWFVKRDETIILYGADMPAGLIVKVRYTNNGASDVKLCLGLFLHEYTNE